MSAELRMVAFLQKYTDVMSLQIEAAQVQVDVSVEQVMRSIKELSISTGKQKSFAEHVIENAYLQPDPQTSSLLTTNQNSTDAIVEFARNSQSADSLSAHDYKSKEGEDELRRMLGVFSKHMESMSTIDDDIRDILLTMVGCLSSADVMKQRLGHVTDILHAMTSHLSPVIENLDVQFDNQVVGSFKETLLDFVYRRYSVEEERADFKRVFGPPPKIIKAYLKKP